MAGGGDGGAGTAFGGYSSLPAEDMPPELAGALASSPHPCRKVRMRVGLAAKRCLTCGARYCSRCCVLSS